MPKMLRPPSIGPIVGHTTTTTARVWMRGSDETEGRTIGIAVLCNARKTPIKETARYFRLHREYDRTGTVDFDGLTPDTAYCVRLGSLTLDSIDDREDVNTSELLEQLPDPTTWMKELKALPEEMSLAAFTTFPPNNGDGIGFVFGSCRYPGLFLLTKKADRIFGSILNSFRKSGALAPRFLLMVGDQIYADKFNKAIPIGRADSPSEFHERYCSAFGSPNMRALLRAVPTYMILDDHEIEDDWAQSRIRDPNKRELFQMAISAYMSYQWIHCPRNFDKNGAPDNNFWGRRFFYSFECGGFPFFVMDSRTQRIRDDAHALKDNHLLGYPSKPSAPGYQGQIDILCSWLKLQQETNKNRPKFIASPSAFVPNSVETVGPSDNDKANRKKCEDDSWAAFPTTRRQILQTIVENNIQNVVFLCGDVHCSNISEISFVHKNNGQPLDLRAYCITSSAFYWPWAFADGDPLSFVHNSSEEGDDFQINDQDDLVMSYRTYNFEQEDNFTRVVVNSTQIAIQNFDQEGNPLGKETKLSWK